jgi:hypothetical protein
MISHFFTAPLVRPLPVTSDKRTVTGVLHTTCSTFFSSNPCPTMVAQQLYQVLSRSISTES